MSPLLYRVFLRPLTVFLLFMAVFCAYTPVFAQNTADPYTVKGISVDVSADSALVARKKAFAEARRKAYETMAAQILTPEQRPLLVVPDDRVIAGVVRDVEIVSEKMTSHRYAGVLDIRFTPQAVKRTMQLAEPGTQVAPVEGDVLAEQRTELNPGAPTSEGSDYVYSPDKKRQTTPASSVHTTLVLPWYGVMGRQTLWGQSNPWRAAWEESLSLSRDKSLSITLPAGDASDMRDYAPPQPLSRNVNIGALMARYNASAVILAIAEPGVNGDVAITLYRYDNDNPVPISRFAVDGGSDVLGEAVSKAAAAIHGLPPIQAAPMQTSMPAFAGPIAGNYRTVVQFANLQEWVAIRNALTRTSGINSMVVRSISPSQARVEFTYGGDVTALVASLAQNSLRLSPLADGAMSDAQYMLIMGQ